MRAKLVRANPKAKAKPKTKAKAKPRKSAPPPAGAGPAPVFDLASALAQAGWREADEALAKVIIEFAALEPVSQKLGRKLRGTPLASHAASVETRLMAASQALRRAMRKRNLHRFAELGAVTNFDPALHELGEPAKRTPNTVRVLAPGIMRGLGPEAEIVLKARVTPVRAPQRRAPPRKSA